MKTDAPDCRLLAVCFIIAVVVYAMYYLACRDMPS